MPSAVAMRVPQKSVPAPRRPRRVASVLFPASVSVAMSRMLFAWSSAVARSPTGTPAHRAKAQLNG